MRLRRVCGSLAQGRTPCNDPRPPRLGHGAKKPEQACGTEARRRPAHATEVAWDALGGPRRNLPRAQETQSAPTLRARPTFDRRTSSRNRQNNTDRRGRTSTGSLEPACPDTPWVRSHASIRVPPVPIENQPLQLSSGSRFVCFLVASAQLDVTPTAHNFRLTCVGFARQTSLRIVWEAKGLLPSVASGCPGTVALVGGPALAFLAHVEASDAPMFAFRHQLLPMWCSLGTSGLRAMRRVIAVVRCAFPTIAPQRMPQRVSTLSRERTIPATPGRQRERCVSLIGAAHWEV